MMNQRQYIEFVKRQLLELLDERRLAVADNRADRVAFIDQRIAHFKAEVKRLRAER